MRRLAILAGYLLVVTVFMGCGGGSVLKIGVPTSTSIVKYPKSVSLFFDQSVKDATAARASMTGAKKFSIQNELESNITTIVNAYFSNVNVVETKNIGDADYLICFSIQTDTCHTGPIKGLLPDPEKTQWWCRFVGKMEIFNKTQQMIYSTTLEGDKFCEREFGKYGALGGVATKTQNCAIEGALNSFLEDIVKNLEENPELKK